MKKLLSPASARLSFAGPMTLSLTAVGQITIHQVAIRQATINLILPCVICALICTLFIPGISGASEQIETLLTGKTMGTYYRIKFISGEKDSRALWKEKVAIRLKEVNARLSMYQKNSELSRFNREPANSPFRVSSDFYRVLIQCRELHRLTGGAWDGTVKPLVDLWGFGTQKATQIIPPDQQITQALALVGFDKLTLSGRTLTKTVPGITLDLGSIAKGYGVDEIARLFREGGIPDCLVDIGGELAGFGTNKNGKPWVVGISKPEKKSLTAGLFDAVTLDNMTVATSGNYRNFFELKGKTFSHIIHPATGRPVDNQVVSASVIAENCTLADGLATALMVMDPQAGLALVNTLPRVECLIIKKEGEVLVPLRSDGFSAFEIQL